MMVPVRQFWKTTRRNALRACIICLTTGIAAIVTLVTQTSEVQASLEQCRALRTELAALRSGTPRQKAVTSNASYNKYNALVRRQGRALKSARRDARGLRCISSSGKRTGRGDASCRPLMAKISKMERNLSRLTSLRDRSSSPTYSTNRSSNRAERRAIKRRIARLGCSRLARQAAREERRAERRKRREGRRLFARLFDNREPEIEEPVLEEEKPRVGRVFRTMCVRMSDGYYFPISFATVQSSFDRDIERCQASDLGTDMRLFYHRNPSEEPEEMVDLNGNPYSSIENAFLYRTKVLPRKEIPRWAKRNQLTEIAGKLPVEINRITGELIPAAEVPKPKPNLFADPDSQLASFGNFELKKIEPRDKQEAETLVEYDLKALQEKGIRIIGPRFFPGQEAAGLLQAPDQTQVR